MRMIERTSLLILNGLVRMAPTLFGPTIGSTSAIRGTYRLVQCLRPLAATVLILFAGQNARAQAVKAEIEVTEKVIAENPVPFGQNLASPRQFFNSVQPPLAGGFEPFLHRQKYHVTEVGTDEVGEWFTASQLSHYASYADGFFDGAKVRVHRMPDDGPYRRVRTDTVKKSQLGRSLWNVTFQPNAIVPASIHSYTDARKTQFHQQTDLDVGETYYYCVRAVDAAGRESSASNEASAQPAAPATGVCVLTTSITPDRGGTAILEACGDNQPMTWDIVKGPSSLSVASVVKNERSKGQLSGLDSLDVEPVEITVRVTDAQGNRDERRRGHPFQETGPRRCETTKSVIYSGGYVADASDIFGSSPSTGRGNAEMESQSNARSDRLSHLPQSLRQ